MIRRLKQLATVAVFAVMIGAGLGAHHAQAAPPPQVHLVSVVTSGAR
jgi:hypothetical protein